MPAALLALGRHLLFRGLGGGGWILIVALIAIVLLIRFWPAITKALERRWRSK